MFDGMSAEQFHQFIAPPTLNRTTATFPLHFPSSLLHLHHHHHHNNNNNNNNTFLPFDPHHPYTNNPSSLAHHHQIPLQQNNLFPPLHHKDEDEEQKQQHEKEEAINGIVSSSINTNLESTSGERDQRQVQDSWSNDEELALLRIRSGMESCFPDLTYTWDHVSRKLGEVGYRKSAEKCKEKFEEESRYFNNIKSYRFVMNEVEDPHDHFYNQLGSINHHHQQEQEEEEEQQQQINEKSIIISEGSSGDMMIGNIQNNNNSNEEEREKKKQQVEEESKSRKKKKKKKRKRMEMVKGMCESIVNKMMEQQEEIHKKLIQEMMTREKEKMEREQEWKKQEMEKLNMELRLMCQEQALAAHRHASIIQLLHHYLPDPPPESLNPNPSSNSNSNNSNNNNNNNNNVIPIPNHETNDCTTIPDPEQNPSDTSLLPQDELNSSSVSRYNKANSSSSSELDVGRRWPRDEVVALINLRCKSLRRSSSSSNSNSNSSSSDAVQDESGGNSSKVSLLPLWERISKGMTELGYSRSAKRCKEKWENINKYFRKTKDSVHNKKRTLDSRTCPYFHHLTTLYTTQGKLRDLAPPPPHQAHHHNFDTILPPLNFH